MKPQTAELKRGVEILVATPGRLLDHIEAKNAVLNQVEYVVLDEADRMLDIGFLPDLQRILSYLPKQRTTLLFSATFSPEIKRLASSYLQNPITIEVARPNAAASTVEQHFYSVGDDDKRRALHQLLRRHGSSQAFVFVNSKLGCARLARSLEREGLKTTALHGDKSQDERLKALDAFKKGEVDLLVCTDVAARGLDIKDVPAVFNFDIPFNAEDYIHRIGRTGRAGASGLAITFVTRSDARLVADLEKLLKAKLEIEPVEFDEDSPDIRRQGRINDGRRMYGGDEVPAEPAWPAAAPRSGGDAEPRERGSARAGPRQAPVSRDPFFDKPYEEPTAADSACRPGSRQRRAPRAAFRPTSRPSAVSRRCSSRKRRSASLEPETPVARLPADVRSASRPEAVPAAIARSLRLAHGT